MDCPKELACEKLKELESRVEEKFEEYDRRLGKGEVNFAVITVKLNIIMGIVSVIGVALVPIILGYVFK